MIVTRRRKREINGQRNIVKATKWRREKNKIITKNIKKRQKDGRKQSHARKIGVRS